jgi:hypothetical protein
MECRPLPTLRDFGHVGVFVYTFGNIAAAAAWIVRPSSLAAHWQGRRYDPPIKVQIITSPSLSSSLAGQGAVLGQFSTAFGSMTSTTRAEHHHDVNNNVIDNPLANGK